MPYARRVVIELNVEARQQAQHGAAWGSGSAGRQAVSSPPCIEHAQRPAPSAACHSCSPLGAFGCCPVHAARATEQQFMGVLLFLLRAHAGPSTTARLLQHPPLQLFQQRQQLPRLLLALQALQRQRLRSHGHGLRGRA